ncbi:hypothetical protein [Gorillibacterium sp. sgz5001074]|uniref:hypothetical protein n=1 Tax=Gorillibacterium sp. sgz5001074 TaxID=3446695 RepID=UPI003F6788A9
MLTFQEKLDICSSFPELQRKDVSLGRVNFHYEESAYDKKTVVYHLHPNGNGFVYAGLVEGAPTDDKGFVNIRDYAAEDLRSLIAKSIRSLAGTGAEDTTPAAPADAGAAGEPEKIRWIGPDHAVLTLHYEDELWYIYSGANLEEAFETMEEARDYLAEEGFTPEAGA